MDEIKYKAFEDRQALLEIISNMEKNNLSVSYDGTLDELKDKARFLKGIMKGKPLQEIVKNVVSLHKIYDNFFITINPDPQKVSFQNFHKKITKLIQRKFIDRYLYNFEWGKNDRLHSHMLITTKDRLYPSKVHEWVVNTFKDLIGTPQHIKVSGVKSDDYRLKIGYILGLKQEKKMPMVHHDKEMRSKLGLKPYYANYEVPDG